MAEITGIGAVSEATLAFYNNTTKIFETKTIKEQMEVVSAVGNIAFKGDNLYVHLHMTLGREDFSSYAGHLVEAKVHGAAEYYIKAYPYKAIKYENKDLNMWIYDLEN